MSQFRVSRTIELALQQPPKFRLEVMRGEKGWTARLSGETPRVNPTGQGVTLENALDDLAAELEPHARDAKHSEQEPQAEGPERSISGHAMRKVEHLFGSESTLMTATSQGPNEMKVELSKSAHTSQKQVIAPSLRDAFLALIGGDPEQPDKQ